MKAYRFKQLLICVTVLTTLFLGSRIHGQAQSGGPQGPPKPGTTPTPPPPPDQMIARTAPGGTGVPAVPPDSHSGAGSFEIMPGVIVRVILTSLILQFRW